MTRVLIRNARRTAALGLAAALAACGVVRDEYVQIGEIAAGMIGGEGEPAPQPSHAEVAALPYASLALWIEDASGPGDPPVLLAATARSNGRGWYLDANRRGIALEGGRLAGTRGFPRDVIGAPLEAGDPLAGDLRPGDWPAATLVVQRRRDGLGRETARAFECRIENAGAERVELYQVSRTLVHMREHCGNARGGFVNDHWIDADTGLMWRSRQWAGPETGFFSIAIIRPLAR